LRPQAKVTPPALKTGQSVENVILKRKTQSNQPRTKGEETKWQLGKKFTKHLAENTPNNLYDRRSKSERAERKVARWRRKCRFIGNM